ncbi:hypothetical protein BDV10DRAFT_164125 [Aspergillus recurvatus]
MSSSFVGCGLTNVFRRPKAVRYQRSALRNSARLLDTFGGEGSKGWLPISLRRLYLLPLSVILLLMAVAIEALRQYSNRHEGIVHYKRKEDLSSAAWRTWTNTPTILALLAMVLWEGFAQDVLRLEPYFQLACARGAPASVLFINYRFDNGILAPVRAAQNRHWVVFCVSSMSLLMRVAVPSLLSGVFVLDPLALVETNVVDTWPNLADLDSQQSWFSTEAADTESSILQFLFHGASANRTESYPLVLSSNFSRHRYQARSDPEPQPRGIQEAES